MPTYFKVLYDTLAGGSFSGEGVAFTELTWTGGGRGQIIEDFPGASSDGKLHVALIAGNLPADGNTLTQGGVTADANGAATTLLYPAYFRLDTDITQDTPTAGEIEIDWDAAGGAPVAAVTSNANENGVIPTHSFFFDGGTGDNFTAGDTITFSGGQTAEIINTIDGVQPTGELEIRITSNIDAGLPVDGDTFTEDGAGTGAGVVQGEMHPRSYDGLALHRLLSDLNDDAQFVGDDDLSMLDPTVSAKDTDQIIRLIGGAHMTDTLALHMFGASVAQTAGPDGDVKYSGLDVQVTTPLASTRPVLIQYDISTGAEALITDKWSTAWNPDSIAGAVRVLVKTRENGVDIDGRRVRGALLELGENYFFGGTTLGDATTSLALFSAGDGNDDQSGASHTTVVLTDGYQELNYNNGNGLTPFGFSFDFGTESSIESYQRLKYLQRRGTSDTIFGLNGQLVVGMNRNFAFDAETAALTENQVIAWGTDVAFDNESGGPFTIGESLTFSGGQKGRLLLLDDNAGTDGNMIVEITGTGSIADGETITGSSSGATADVNDLSLTIESRSGLGWLCAYDDDGTTGNVYYQAQTGLDPVDDQLVYQLITGALESVTVNEPTDGVNSRTINNQFPGIYTGTNFQTNFGIAVDPSDAILGDLNRNLLDVQQGVPNNQTGTVTNLVIGDYVTVYPWDGSTVDANGDAVPDYDQMVTATTILNGAAVTTIEVNSIPDNTPQDAWLRVTNDEGLVVRIPYTSWTGNTFTLTAAYDFSGSGLNDSVAIGNNVMIGYLDLVATGVQESYTAVKGAGNTQLAVTVRRGDNGPIVPFKTNPTFGASGFSVSTGRISDA